jgi:hypothetical protein
MERRGTIRQPDRRKLGLIRATVADNQDPAQRMRLKLIIPEVSGASAAYPTWAWPAQGFGKRDGKVWGSTLALPEVGDVVWVEFVMREPTVGEDEPVWMPGWAIDGATPALLLEHYGKRRGLVTPSGHSLYFDDSDAADGDVQLAHRDGAALVLTGDGKAKLDSKSGSGVELAGAQPGGDLKAVVRVDDTGDAGMLYFTPNAGMAPAVLAYTPPPGPYLPAAPPTIAIPLSVKMTTGSPHVSSK